MFRADYRLFQVQIYRSTRGVVVIVAAFMESNTQMYRPYLGFSVLVEGISRPYSKEENNVC